LFKNKHLEPYLYHFCNLKQAIFSVKRKKHSNKKIIPKKKWFILKKIVTLHIQNLKNNFMAKKQVNTKVNEVENIEAALTKTEMFIEKNRKEMMIGLGVLIAIVLAIIAFNNFYRIPAEKEAQDKMVVCVDYFERDSFNLALYGDGINDGLEAIIDDYSITDAAELASVYAGICCYNLGEYEKAVKYLNKFNAKSVNITPAVIGLIGDCYVEMEDYKAAANFFEKAAAQQNDLTGPIFLKKAGLAYEEMEQYDKAEKVYNKIKDVYFDSEEAKDIDKYITRVNALKAK
jgi:tetratricopeptide (TPR) repeat protein